MRKVANIGKLMKKGETFSRGLRGSLWTTSSRSDSPRCAAELAWWTSPKDSLSVSCASKNHPCRFFGGILVSLFLVTGGLVGCSSGAAGEGQTSAAASTSSTETSVASDAGTTTSATAFDLEYSKRDLDASYDAATATRLTLSGSSASVEGAGAAASGSTVTISQAGTYVVAGSLDDGQLVVDAADDAKIQIVFDGVTIHNEDGPAVYVKAADKVFITLAEGTSNALTDTANYVLEEGSDEPSATLFSKADLTLNGTGTLAVTGSYRHAICSKDDLVITGGTYNIEAAEDALRGRDCVKVKDGTFTVKAVGDGIKANNDEDALRGFVSIDGGTFDINAGDDGIQAYRYLRVAGGVIAIVATDDALHSDTEALIAGGTLSIDAGDDAVHAETVLTVDGGTIDVTACFEGYEAEKVYINGGETHLVASDDALNAASAAATTTDAATGESANERMRNGGAPQTGMAEGGMGMGDANCVLQINGGYTVLDAGGDGVDSNGSVEITGGVLLVDGPTDSGNGVFDYDLTATVSGGTVLMVGSAGMAQNFTSGTQSFALASAGGQAGQNVAITDANGNVVASFTSNKRFGMVLASSPSFAEGGTYSLVVGGEVTGANADGYTAAGSVSGGTSSEISASTTAAGGMGGLGAGGGGMAPGMGGDVQRGMRGAPA